MSGNKRPLSSPEPERKRKQPRTLRSTLPTNGQTQSDQVFFPDIKSEAKDTIDNIEKALNLPYDLAKMINICRVPFREFNSGTSILTGERLSGPAIVKCTSWPAKKDPSVL
jgi:hypothetical protein